MNTTIKEMVDYLTDYNTWTDQCGYDPQTIERRRMYAFGMELIIEHMADILDEGEDEEC